jgi:hypothetical protein
MPRLSLYKPEKGNDYKFIDRQISEAFQVGATDVYLHKYIGPSNPDPENATADQPHYADGIKETNIQDLLFLENRDRKYDPSIYTIRGLYNVQNIDFNLSQFGLFIDNDTIYMTVHINDFINYIGRKPLSGDVLELPHLRDNFALNDYEFGLPRYYVIEDVGRASEGFSSTWYPHLYRLKLKKITDGQQFADILNKPMLDANGDPVAGKTIGDVLSTRAKELEINQSVLDQAESDAPKSGFETRQFFTIATNASGETLLETADETDILASATGIGAESINQRPLRSGYTGYLLGDAYIDADGNSQGAPNGADFGHGIQFPSSALKSDYFLRTDMLPNRLFRYDGSRWIKVEDAVRHTMTNDDNRSTLKTGFINNTAITGRRIILDSVYHPNAVTNTIQTPVPFVAGMGAKVVIGDVIVKTSSVTSGASGNALITLSISAQAGSAVSWTLYDAYIEERQALSKALKPRADL